MTNPTFAVQQISSVPAVIQSGSISGRNGLREAFVGASRSTQIKDQIIRIVASDLTGLIGVLYGRYITGARISEREVTVDGLDAIRQLLSLQTGAYDVLNIEREILTRKLKQSLGLDLHEILAAAQFNPEADLLELFEQQAAARLINESATTRQFAEGLYHEVIRPASDDSVLKISLSLARELFPQPPSSIFSYSSDKSAECVPSSLIAESSKAGTSFGASDFSSLIDSTTPIHPVTTLEDAADFAAGTVESSTEISTNSSLSHGKPNFQECSEFATVGFGASLEPTMENFREILPSQAVTESLTTLNLTDLEKSRLKPASIKPAVRMTPKALELPAECAAASPLSESETSPGITPSATGPVESGEHAISQLANSGQPLIPCNEEVASTSIELCSIALEDKVVITAGHGVASDILLTQVPNNVTLDSVPSPFDSIDPPLANLGKLIAPVDGSTDEIALAIIEPSVPADSLAVSPVVENDAESAIMYSVVGAMVDTNAIPSVAEVGLSSATTVECLLEVSENIAESSVSPSETASAITLASIIETLTECASLAGTKTDTAEVGSPDSPSGGEQELPIEPGEQNIALVEEIASIKENSEQLLSNELPPVNYVVVTEPLETPTENSPANDEASPLSPTAPKIEESLPPVNFVLINQREDESPATPTSTCTELVPVADWSSEELQEQQKKYDLAALNAIPTPAATGIVATQNQKMVVLQDLEATLTKARTGAATGQFRTITTERLKPAPPSAPPPPGPTAPPPQPVRDTAPATAGDSSEKSERTRAGSQSYQSLRVKQQSATSTGRYKESTELYLTDIRKKINVDGRKFVDTGKHVAVQKPLKLNLLAIAVAVCVIVCFAVGVRLITGANETLSSADNKLRAGDFAGATAMYTKLIESDPKNFAGYAGRAAATAVSSPSSAFDDYKKALELSPESKAIRVKYAALLLREGQTANALAQATIVLRQDAQDAGAHLVLGVCHAKLGNFEEAIPSLQIAFKSNVGARAEVCYYLYEACLHCKRKPEAAMYIDEAIKVAPANARYLIDRARLKVSDNDFSAAKKDLVEAIKLAPANAEPRYLLGICEYEQRLIRPAISNWTDALNRGYNTADVLVHRGHAYLELGQYHEALSDLEQYLQFKPDDRSALAHRNVALFQVKKRMPTLTALREDSVKPVHYKGTDAVKAGYNALRAKDSSSAVSILSTAVKTNPDNPLARKYLAYAHLREGNIDKAVRQFQAWSYLQPVPRKEMLVFATTCMDAGKYNEASHIYSELVKAEPTNSAARVQLIKCCSLAGDNDKARTLCLEAMGSAKDPHEYQRYKVLLP